MCIHWGDVGVTVLPSEPVDRSFAAFLGRASVALDSVQQALDSHLRPALKAGFWHPTGFQVFNLRDFPGLGIARLHVWPAHNRETRSHHPVVHSHAFHLYSRVLRGEYREKLYKVSPWINGAKWLGWSVLPPTGDGFDRVALDRSPYSVEPLGPVDAYPAGVSHQMEAGEYHATTIPKAQSVVTLAFLSRPVPGQADHLVGGQLELQRVSARLPVLDEDLTWLDWTRLIEPAGAADDL